MSFSADLSRLAKKTGDTLETTARNVKVKLFSAVILDTRVDTGRLRGNWQTSVGQPKTNTLEREDKIPQGVHGGAAEAEALATPRGDTVDYLTNNLPYAEVYEEKDGMIEKNLARLSRNIKEAIRGIK